MFPDISYILLKMFNLEPDGWIAEIKTYGVFLFLAITGAVSLLKYIVLDQKKSSIYNFEKNRPIYNDKFFKNVFVIAAFFGVVGSKIVVLIENYELFYKYSIVDVILYKTGIAFLGGFLGGAMAILIFLKRKKLEILPLLDAATPAIFLGYSIGRVGCHLSGDGDWGIEATQKPNWWFLPNWIWSFNFPHNVLDTGIKIEGCTYKFARILSNPVYPTSFYESVLALIFCIITWNLLKNNTRTGNIFAFYLFSTGFLRFFIEFIRINEKHSTILGALSQAQVISICLVLLGIGIFVKINFFNAKIFIKNNNAHPR